MLGVLLIRVRVFGGPYERPPLIETVKSKAPSRIRPKGQVGCRSSPDGPARGKGTIQTWTGAGLNPDNS